MIAVIKIMENWEIQRIEQKRELQEIKECDGGNVTDGNQFKI